VDTFAHRAGHPSLARLCRSQLTSGAPNGAYHRDQPREDARQRRRRGIRSTGHASGRQGTDPADQALLLDFVHGRLYFFFAEIWPQDLYLVTGLLVLASSILILANALAGRLWCGFACSQTVWSDQFLLVERLIEGNRRQLLKNVGAPLDAKRVMQIVAKYSAWLLISLATSGTLIFYFTDAPELLRSFLANILIDATPPC